MLIKNTKSLHHTTIKVILYGPSGGGKTTTAKTLDHDKTLIISGESGLLPLSGCSIDVFDLTVDDKNNIVQPADRINNIVKIYNALLSDTKYDNIFIDSLTELSQIISDSLDKKYPDRKDGLVKWSEYNKLMTNIVLKFRDLQKNVIFTCLSKVEKDENNKRYQDFAVFGSISNRLPQYFDEVFFLNSYKNESGQIVRSLQTQFENGITAKDRSGKLDLFEQPNLNLIIKKIRQ